MSISPKARSHPLVMSTTKVLGNCRSRTSCVFEAAHVDEAKRIHHIHAEKGCFDGLEKDIEASSSVVLQAFSRPAAGNGCRCRDLRRRVRGTCPEAVLYRLLKRIPPEARSAALARCFSQQQRLSLERWILAQRSLPSNLRAEQPRFVWHAPAGTAVATARGKRQMNRNNVGSRTFLGGAHATGTSPPSSVSNGIPMRVIAGRTSYSARAFAGPFSLFAKSAGNLAEASERQQVLDFLQQRYLVASATKNSAAASREVGESRDVIGQAFCQALTELLANYDKDLLLRMGICFAATVPAKYWVGRSLCTPRFAVMNPVALSSGLRAWRRLSDARGLVKGGPSNRYTILTHHTPQELKAAWQQIKTAYVDIWAGTGRCRVGVEANLAKLEARHSHFQQRLVQRWHLSQLAQSQRGVAKKPRQSASVVGFSNCESQAEPGDHQIGSRVGGKHVLATHIVGVDDPRAASKSRLRDRTRGASRSASASRAHKRRVVECAPFRVSVPGGGAGVGASEQRVISSVCVDLSVGCATSSLGGLALDVAHKMAPNSSVGVTVDNSPPKHAALSPVSWSFQHVEEAANCSEACSEVFACAVKTSAAFAHSTGKLKLNSLLLNPSVANRATLNQIEGLLLRWARPKKRHGADQRIAKNVVCW